MSEFMAAWPVFDVEEVVKGRNAAQGVEGSQQPVDAPAAFLPRVIVHVPASERCTMTRTFKGKAIPCCLAAGHELEQDHF